MNRVLSSTPTKNHKGKSWEKIRKRDGLLVGYLERQSSHFRARRELSNQRVRCEYFHSRPASSRLGAWASDQSVSDRVVLELRLQGTQNQI